MRILIEVILTIALICGMTTVSDAVTSEPNPPAGAPATSAPPSEHDQSGLNIMKGEVLKIEGSDYTIRDSHGKEVRLKADAGTKIHGSPQVGDRIEVEISSGGRAAAIKKVM